MAEGPIFTEVIDPHVAISSSISAIYHSHESPFQDIHVLDAKYWGRCLILDGHMQSAENDEFVYHESLVHPTLLSHPCPKRIFVGGGGEGATIRETLRYKSVEKVVMVDIDGECVEVCRKYLPRHHKGGFDDPRLELVIDDAKAWLENHPEEKFDVMIFDLSDPVEGGPAKLLYTEKFYKMCMDRLNSGGFLVTQSGPAGVLSHNQVFSAINKTLRNVFPAVFGYGVHIPSFMDRWGFNLAATDPNFNPFNLKEDEVDTRLVALGPLNELKFLDGPMYKALFILPKCIKATLATEDRVITEEAPLVIP